jgi:hypothetical protein
LTICHGCLGGITSGTARLKFTPEKEWVHGANVEPDRFDSRLFTKNNGITEGFHNKMETISRQAFGFRNFENYRLRVKVLCG